MKQTLLRIEPEQLQPAPCRHRQRSRATVRSDGFFTIGFAIVVLAAGSLFVAAADQLPVAETASVAAPGEVAAGREQPQDQPKADGAGRVVIGEAPAALANSARIDAAPVQ
ncbi:MAG: hypothetical protein IPM30_11450 [Burkholderiales bacterium]|nr:hypothetical protein [Burkholderiales bacterium]